MATDAIWYEWEREEVMVPSYFERVWTYVAPQDKFEGLGCT
jgi:hypothetical protein